MADLKDRFGSEDEGRGQLLLVTGLAIAFAIVAIVLLLNTAIYTQNLASRNPSPGADDALQYRQEVVSGIEGILHRENFEEYAYLDESDLQTSVDNGVNHLADQLSRQHAERGTSVSVSSVTLSGGDLVRQTDSSRDFTGAASNGNREDWNVAFAATGTRDFEMTVKDNGLESASVGSFGDAFRVRVFDGTSQWQMFVYENGGDIVVAVKNDTSAAVEACRTNDNDATISLSDGSLDGTNCPKLDWAKGVSTPYTIRYENGQNAEGTYEFVVEGFGFNPDLNNGPGSASPYQVPAVYSVQMDIAYRTADVEYEATVTAAPGAHDD
jgi:hypothetical protein